MGEASEKRPISQPIWMATLVSFLLSLITEVKNAHVAEQLHRPGLFNRFLVNYISSWILSRFLMMIFLKVTSFSSLEKFIAISGGCDFTLMKLSSVHRSFSCGQFFQIPGPGAIIMWCRETWGPSPWQVLRSTMLAPDFSAVSSTCGDVKHSPFPTPWNLWICMAKWI